MKWAWRIFDDLAIAMPALAFAAILFFHNIPR